MFIIYKLNDNLYDNYIDGNLITDHKIIKYVKSLVIPPAYKNVKIYYSTNNEIPKILYEGFDSKNRKQVIYSKEWCAAKENEKFKNLIEFSKMIPSITKTIDKFLLSQKLSKNKTISIILKLIIECGFRIGNKKYLQLYDSYGISNIKKKTYRN
jgi:DNA topoisomerase-1